MRVSIEADLQGARLALAGLEEYTKYLHRDILRAVATGAVREIKAEFPFKKHSGELYRRTVYHLTRDGHAAIITNEAKNEQGVKYGFVLIRGATIKPKHKKALYFGDGIFVKKVLLTKHDWIVAPAKKFVESGAREAAVQKAIDKALNRLEKKGVIVR